MGCSLDRSYISGASAFNYNDIEPGVTVPVIVGFELISLDEDVTITATDSTHYANEVLYAHTFTIDELVENTKYYVDQYNIIEGELNEGL